MFLFSVDRAVIRELVETEEEFVADMDHVVTKYYNRMDHATTPRRVSDQRDAIFGPFKQIHEFHKRLANIFNHFIWINNL